MGSGFDIANFLRFARDNLSPDVTVQRLLVLLGVARNEGISQRELSDLLPGISVTAMSRNLADLSARTSRKTPGPALIKQVHDPDNLRRKQLYLTTKGRRFIARWQQHLPDQSAIIANG